MPLYPRDPVVEAVRDDLLKRSQLGIGRAGFSSYRDTERRKPKHWVTY